jgi:hypothetical protein
MEGDPISLSEAVRTINALPDDPICSFSLSPVFADPTPPPSDSGKQRRRTVKWSPEEQEYLINGFCRYGRLWTEILKQYPFHPQRIHTDLRDKWTNIQAHADESDCARLFTAVKTCADYRDRQLANPEGNENPSPFPILQRISDIVHQHIAEEPPELRLPPDAFVFPL